MKRAAPWEATLDISSDDSLGSDSEDSGPEKSGTAAKISVSQSSKDLTSEGALIKRAKMYQEYMKSIPIPSYGDSVIPFTSWQGLGRSVKQLYGQPLHYLPNSLLKKWDQSRFACDDVYQPLDTIIHPVKAEALIWVTEELHRLTTSHHYLASLWASDLMYHAHIDPIFA
ncbi:hypothetical protein J5N97_009923 [Dioscorea zingiberensis]|uniref:Protein RDM1 n=1 Tax=Dioscorea zingiberensis TaxID=325984 RepID=A0A9D5D0B8_9LILI|nr:hypothetical protein J5N97_009923 [Dioscorea zingiberensis]